MTDFFTRVAQRAIGAGPAIQPVVVSRYAPARVPLAELPELEADPGLTTEASARNVEARSSAFSTLPIRNARPRTITKRNAEAQPARETVNPLPAQPEPTLPAQLEPTLLAQPEPTLSDQPEPLLTGQSELSRPTPFDREVQPAPAHAVAVFAQEELPANREIIDGRAFRSSLTEGVESPLSTGAESLLSKGVESRSILKSDEGLISNVRETVLPREPPTDYSASEERRFVDRDSENVARRHADLISQRIDFVAPSDKTPDSRSVSPRARQPAGSLEKGFQEEPLQTEEDGILTLERESPSTEPARTRREANPRESFAESFAESSASSFPVLPEERVETSSPIIRVTIGRIDVRAVTPPSPPPQPSAPPAPKLSLDEFLRQHNGRRQ